MQHFLFCIPHYYSHINRMVALLLTRSWNHWTSNRIRLGFGSKFDHFNHRLSIVPAIRGFYVCSIESISRCAQDFNCLKSSICVHTKTPNKLVRIHTWMWKEKISCAISCVSLCLSAKRPPSHINIIYYNNPNVNHLKPISPFHFPFPSPTSPFILIPTQKFAQKIFLQRKFRIPNICALLLFTFSHMCSSLFLSLSLCLSFSLSIYMNLCLSLTHTICLSHTHTLDCLLIQIIVSLYIHICVCCVQLSNKM